VAHRWSASALVLLAIVLLANTPRAQTPGAGNAAASKPTDDHDLFKTVLTRRAEYQKSLEQLHSYYQRTGDQVKERWAREELIGYHRIPKHAFILALVVPPPNLQGNEHVAEANHLITWGLQYKNKGGLGVEYIDNQRRAELIFQEILTKYPHCDKISDVAFFLGEIYEGSAYRQFELSAEYYQRCFQWNPKTSHEARLRAARLYDRQLKNRSKAIELYREVEARDLDLRRKDEAKKRIAELSGTRS
jgi:TolA-binding protein